MLSKKDHIHQRFDFLITEYGFVAVRPQYDVFEEIVRYGSKRHPSLAVEINASHREGLELEIHTRRLCTFILGETYDPQMIIEHFFPELKDRMYHGSVYEHESLDHALSNLADLVDVTIKKLIQDRKTVIRMLKATHKIPLKERRADRKQEQAESRAKNSRRMAAEAMTSKRYEEYLKHMRTAELQLAKIDQRLTATEHKHIYLAEKQLREH